jgi:hypothetical protein
MQVCLCKFLQAYEKLHSQLEVSIAAKDECRLKLMEHEHEKQQLLAYMLSEGLQIPRLIPFNVKAAREKLKDEYLNSSS